MNGDEIILEDSWRMVYRAGYWQLQHRSQGTDLWHARERLYLSKQGALAAYLRIRAKDMSRSWAWAFDVKVTYTGPDQHGAIRQWHAVERLTGIGHSALSEDEARVIADRLLTTDYHTREVILGKYPSGATATLGPGRLYQQHLPDMSD